MHNLLEFLKTRRSTLAMTLVEPGPGVDDILTMIEIASRVPDHGKLAPWRFIEYDSQCRKAMAAELQILANSGSDQTNRGLRDKELQRFLGVPVVIGVVSCAVDNPKVPQWEQHLSAGAAAMQLLSAAHALNFGAQWLTGWFSREAGAVSLLGLRDGERFAGLIHIGTPSIDKSERDRPAIADIFSRHSVEGN